MYDPYEHFQDVVFSILRQSHSCAIFLDHQLYRLIKRAYAEGSSVEECVEWCECLLA